MSGSGALQIVRMYFAVSLSTLNRFCSSYGEFFGVADFLGEGDEVVVGLVAFSFLMKKSFMSLNFAARELFGRTLAPKPSTAIVWRRVPDLSVSQALPTE